MLALAERLDDPAALQTRLLPVLGKLSDDHAALALSTVAAQYQRRGRWDLAHETYALLVDRYPAHPLSAAAYRWLIRHDSSSEVRRRYELKQFVARTKFDLSANGKPGDHAKPAVATGPGGPVQHAHLTDPLARAAYQNTLECGKRLAGFGPLEASDPSTQFCLQAARRGMGDLAGATGWCNKFQGYVKQGPWHDAAQAELWLAGLAPVPRKLARCRLTDRRPYLDGDFDDPCWQNVKPLVLDNAVGDTARDYPTQALFAYDQEFLYIAVKCKHPRGKQLAPVKPRQRNANVAPYDRISLLLDLDRDYATYFHLQIDQRGCVREDCWGELNWNPHWFVVVKSADDGWQVEAAIPLGELTGQRLALNTAWAFNLVRIVPGQGVQSWSQPADVRPRPEGMSLLLFQQDAERARRSRCRRPRDVPRPAMHAATSFHSRTGHPLADLQPSATVRNEIPAAAYNEVMNRTTRTVSPEPPVRVYWGAEVPMREIRRFAPGCRALAPDRIILFGSHAYGTPHADSDVDILVIMPARNQLDQAYRIRLAVDACFPMDLIVRTPHNISRRLRDGDLFHTEIVTRGKVLYEKGHSRVGPQSRGRLSPRNRNRTSTAPAE